MTVGSVDPTGQSGIIVDRSRLSLLGVEAINLATAVILHPGDMVPLGSEIVRRQLKAYADPHLIVTVKTGFIGTRENVEVISGYLEDQLSRPRAVVDTYVEVADGHPGLSSTAISLLKMRLLPLADLAIAYLSEAERLAGVDINTIDQIKEAALAMQIYGSKAVLIRSDRLIENELVDVVYDGEEHHLFYSKVIPQSSVRAERDIFSTTIAAYLTRGQDLNGSIESARRLLTAEEPGRKKWA